MIASFTASPVLSGSFLAARGATSLQMAAGADGYKPWDVKQEGGQLDSGWGSGKKSFLILYSIIPHLVRIPEILSKVEVSVKIVEYPFL